MTHVVSENCIKCKYTDCVDVCPVDCFRRRPEHAGHQPRRVHRLRRLRARVPGQRHLCRRRPARSRAGLHQAQRRADHANGWKPITKRKAALADADEWNGQPGKIKDLQR